MSNWCKSARNLHLKACKQRKYHSDTAVIQYARVFVMFMWCSYPKTSDKTAMCVSCCSDGGWWAEFTPLHLHHRTLLHPDNHINLLYTSDRAIWSSTERAFIGVLYMNDSALHLIPPSAHTSQSEHKLQWLMRSSSALWFTAAAADIISPWLDLVNDFMTGWIETDG